MSNGGRGTVGRIMVVDDDVVTARFMTHVLGKRGGFEVCHAPDPRSALAMARTQPWDLVITDVEMPGMSGLELLRALREVSPDDVNTDHRHTHRAVMAAAAEVARVYCFQSPSATVDFRPSRFVAIDAD